MVHIIDLHFQGLPETIAAFLIETPAGPVLIETGPHSTYPALVEGLASHNLRPEDIRHVFLSHIHLDHAGAAWALARLNATVYVHPFGEKHLQQPERLMNSARRIYLDKMDSLWGEMHPIAPERLRTVGHGELIDLGGLSIRAWHTPGHAVHHIVWQIDDMVFTGDVAGVKIDAGIVVPPCPPPDINLEDWQHSLQLLFSIAPRVMYLTHYGPVYGIKDHLNQLEERLISWANWMLPHFKNGDTQESITPKFQAFVRQQLVEHNIGALGLEQYEAANPSWMSVAGLLRYWSKKLETAS